MTQFDLVSFLFFFIVLEMEDLKSGEDHLLRLSTKSKLLDSIETRNAGGISRWLRDKLREEFGRENNSDFVTRILGEATDREIIEDKESNRNKIEIFTPDEVILI